MLQRSLVEVPGTVAEHTQRPHLCEGHFQKCVLKMEHPSSACPQWGRQEWIQGHDGSVEILLFC